MGRRVDPDEQTPHVAQGALDHEHSSLRLPDDPTAHAAQDEAAERAITASPDDNYFGIQMASLSEDRPDRRLVHDGDLGVRPPTPEHTPSGEGSLEL
jgi:hypothetical protein